MTKSASLKVADKSPSKKSKAAASSAAEDKPLEAATMPAKKATTAAPGVVIREVKIEKVEKAKAPAESPVSSDKKKKRVKHVPTRRLTIKALRKQLKKVREESGSGDTTATLERETVMEDALPMLSTRQDQFVDLEVDDAAAEKAAVEVEAEKPEEKEEGTIEEKEEDEKEEEKVEEEVDDAAAEKAAEEEEKNEPEEPAKTNVEEANEKEWDEIMAEFNEKTAENESEIAEEGEKEKEKETAEEEIADDAAAGTAAVEEKEKEDQEDDITAWYSSDEEEKKEKEKERKRKGKAVATEKRKRAVEEALPVKKKLKGEPSQSAIKVAAARKKECWEALKQRRFLCEQGFEPELMDIPQHILRKINERGWRKFCVPQAHEAGGAWVREFYAGIEDEDSYCSTVQNKVIHWAPENWNELYELEPQEECQYERLLRSPSKALLEKCLQRIGNPKAQWTGGVHKKTFQAGMLNPEAHTWATFAKSCLMPTSHDSSLTSERCLLLYAIMEGLYIDVGKILAREIKRWKLKTHGKIFFPHSISALCARQGLKPKPNDDIQPKRKPLNAHAEAKVRSSKKKSAEVGVAAGIAELMAEQKRIKQDQRKYYAYASERDAALRQFLADFKQPGPLFPAFPDILAESSSSEDDE